MDEGREVGVGIGNLNKNNKSDENKKRTMVRVLIKMVYSYII
jgi:hypothetical protein